MYVYVSGKKRLFGEGCIFINIRELSLKARKRDNVGGKYPAKTKNSTFRLSASPTNPRVDIVLSTNYFGFCLFIFFFCEVFFLFHCIKEKYKIQSLVFIASPQKTIVPISC